MPYLRYPCVGDGRALLSWHWHLRIWSPIAYGDPSLHCASSRMFPKSSHVSWNAKVTSNGPGMRTWPPLTSVNWWVCPRWDVLFTNLFISSPNWSYQHKFSQLQGRRSGWNSTLCPISSTMSKSMVMSNFFTLLWKMLMEKIFCIMKCSCWRAQGRRMSIRLSSLLTSWTHYRLRISSESFLIGGCIPSQCYPFRSIKWFFRPNFTRQRNFWTCNHCQFRF